MTSSLGVGFSKGVKCPSLFKCTRPTTAVSALLLCLLTVLLFCSSFRASQLKSYLDFSKDVQNKEPWTRSADFLDTKIDDSASILEKLINRVTGQKEHVRPALIVEMKHAMHESDHGLQLLQVHGYGNDNDDIEGSNDIENIIVSRYNSDDNDEISSHPVKGLRTNSNPAIRERNNEIDALVAENMHNIDESLLPVSPACHPHFHLALPNYQWSNSTKFKRIYFYHARKAGGTSLHHYLRSVAEHYGLEYEAKEWYEMEEPGTQERDTFYVTHIREPVSCGELLD